MSSLFLLLRRWSFSISAPHFEGREFLKYVTGAFKQLFFTNCNYLQTRNSFGTNGGNFRQKLLHFADFLGKNNNLQGFRGKNPPHPSKIHIYLPQLAAGCISQNFSFNDLKSANQSHKKFYLKKIIQYKPIHVIMATVY